MPPESYQSTGELLRNLLTIAWLLPLAGFAIEVFGGWWGKRTSKVAAFIAIGCIATGFICSTAALVTWGTESSWQALAAHEVDHAHGDHHAGEHDAHGHDTHSHEHGDGEHHPADHKGGDHKSDGHEGGGQSSGHGDEPADKPESEAGYGPRPPAEAPPNPRQTEGDGGVAAAVAVNTEAESTTGGAERPTWFSGTFYTLAEFGSLRLSIDYYIDSLTLVMFCMVTLIATCIHIFAIGYMSDELTLDHVDHEVHLSNGKHLHRPGRFYRFFSYMSLFCFSMLGLVLAGNIFQVFVFWELVGICSYLLIGFYVERKSASTAANKAFIMNRVGDFGFLIGLMVIWTWFGTFNFVENVADNPGTPGLFEMVRGADGKLDVAEVDGTEVVLLHNLAGEQVDQNGAAYTGAEDQTPLGIPYFLLTVAGLGVFAGCVGKSAQFPLQTWLPDAMEGPTPVSALVHSATMVAAGVYLAGRFFPMFTPEVLLTIAYVGCITLFLAATIAVVATDIKRVLAYSTISQLGYMMLAIGVGGWVAGLFHLITHAFFKSLMFLASGSVIIGCHHEQEMPKMGGLWRKMPITAFTMLVGVIAISGLSIPGLVIWQYKAAFSGFHSKDGIVATALAFTELNPIHFLLFIVPLVTAGITAFYMFRLWFFTFAGKPRDQHVYDHCHESPWVMTGPLVVLSVFAAFVAFDGESIVWTETSNEGGQPVTQEFEQPGMLYGLLAWSQPTGLEHGLTYDESGSIALPATAYIHGHIDAAGEHVDPEVAHSTSPHSRAGMLATIVAFTGLLVAWLLYGAGVVNPAEIKRQLSGVHHFLVEKWHFDTLYNAMFERPVHIVSRWAAGFDRIVIDGLIHGISRSTVKVARWDRRFDEAIIDGLVNLVGNVTFSTGRSLRVFQTGSMRQYVMFIAVGVLTLFVLLFAFIPK